MWANFVLLPPVRRRRNYLVSVAHRMRFGDIEKAAGEP
jgi:hypothetical protein